LCLGREEVRKEETIIFYRVGAFSDDKTKWQEVIYDQGEELIVTCTCAMFETDGILRKHILHLIICGYQLKVIADH